MAIQHADNWSMYGRNVGFLTNGVYAQVINSPNTSVRLVDDPDGTTAGTVLYMSATLTDPSLVRFINPTTQTVFGQATRLWLNRIPAASNDHSDVFRFRNAANADVIYGQHNTVGGIDVYSGAGVLLGSTPGPVITANAWWHHEVKVDIGAGTCEIRIEGVTVLSLTGLSLGNGPFQQWALTQNISATSNLLAYYKDTVFWDGSGSRNNDFLGSVTVFSMSPASDISVPWSLTGAANGFSILAQSGPNDATKYLSAPFPGIPGPCSFSLTPLPGTVTSVRGIMTMIRAEKTDGGDGSLQTGLISGATTGEGADRPITAAFTYWRDIFETDPDTDDTWTVSAANAAKLTFNRTT